MSRRGKSIQIESRIVYGQDPGKGEKVASMDDTSEYPCEVNKKLMTFVS